MSFFDKKNAIEAASKKRSGGKAAAGMAAAAVAAGGAIIASEAGAATLANVASYTVNDDGSLTVTYADGSTATFAAGSYTISGGQVSIGGGSGAMLAGGAAGLAALAAMALSGGEAAAAADAPAADADADVDADDDADDSDDDADSGDDDATAGTFTPSGFTGGDFTGVTATAVSSSTPDVDGTAGNDIFSMADATSAPLVIDGDAGDDKLEITSGATATLDFSDSAADPKVVIDNIEEIEIDPIGTIANPVVTLASSGTTNDDVTLVDIDNASGDVEAAGLDGGDRIEVEGGITSLKVAMAGGTGDTSLIVGVEGVGKSSDAMELTETTSTDVVETLTLEATVADSFVDLADFDKLKTLNLGGDKALDLDVDDTVNTLETIDASNSTGGVTYDDEALNAKLASITGGSGKDAFTLFDGTYTKDMSVSLGAGDDTLDLSAAVVMGSKELTIDAGAGKDTIDLTGLQSSGMVKVTTGDGIDTVKIGDVADTSTPESDAVITDFTVGASGDILDLHDLTGAVEAAVTVASAPASPSATVDGTMYIITYETDFNIDSAPDMASALGDINSGTATNGEGALFVVTDGTDSAIWQYTEANAGTDGIGAAELALVVTLEGVSDLTQLHSDNFSDFTIA